MTAARPDVTNMELLDKPIAEDDVAARLDVLATRYRQAGGPVIQLLNAVGGQSEDVLSRLPEALRGNLTAATENALRIAMKVATQSRGVVGDQPAWLTRAVTTAMGAAGGFGGLTSALAELPVTTTILLHGIQGVAVEHGFDPKEESVGFDCVQVFASAGPLDHDDGSDLAFISTRLVVSGPAMQALVARVAPRLATVLGQKLAAQAVPVLGAVAGAATNYAYASYYREMAHVHFGLRRLAIESDRNHADLVAAIRQNLMT